MKISVRDREKEFVGYILRLQHVKLNFYVCAELLGPVWNLSCIKHSIKIALPKLIYCVLMEESLEY